MPNTEIRQRIHQLVDKANENQLNVLLEVLEPSESRFTTDELSSFYKRIDLIEATNDKGFDVEESHALIRSKFKQHGL
jgi:hypothetical protein